MPRERTPRRATVMPYLDHLRDVLAAARARWGGQLVTQVHDESLSGHWKFRKARPDELPENKPEAWDQLATDMWEAVKYAEKLAIFAEHKAAELRGS